MRKIIMASTLLAAGFVAPAMADGSEGRFASRPDGPIVSQNEVSKGIENLGYRVERIKAEHCCYEVGAVNDSGFPIKAVYARTTGELLRAKLR